MYPIIRIICLGAVVLAASNAVAQELNVPSSADAAERHPLVMYNRDRTASFPDATIPYSFDGKTGANIMWKTRLPYWSNSNPIVSNGRVFCLSEPWERTGYSPWLLCIDADSGKELWRQELDAVDAFPPAEQAALRKQAQETWAWWREHEALWSECLFTWRARKKEFDGWDKPPADLAARWKTIGDKVKADGFEWREIRSQAGGVAAPFRPRRKGPADARRADLAAKGLVWEASWRGFGPWLGVGYPTPCADGQRVWTVTMHNLWSCHDRDGKLLWQRRFPPPSGNEFSQEQRKRLGVGKRWRPRYPGQGGFSSSPLLVDLDGDRATADDLVIVGEFCQLVRCLDADTGKERWKHPIPFSNDQASVIPAIVRVDGEAVFVSMALGGETRKRKGIKWPGYVLLRLRDGVPVGHLPGYVLGKGASNGAIVRGNDVVLWGAATKRRGPKPLIRHRLSWNVDQTAIVTEEVWRTSVPVPKGFNPMRRTARHGGMVYTHDGKACDLANGKIIDLKPKTKAHAGYCGAMAFLVGEAVATANIYGGRWVQFTPKDETCGEFVFFHKDTGKLLGIGRIPKNPEGGATEAQKIAAEHRGKRWRWIGCATPWAEGDRLYIRAYDFLWCIGEPGKK